MTQNVLVTGGAGYIGSNTCKALSLAGFMPITVDNMIYGHPWAVKWGELAEGDIRDKSFLGQVFASYSPVAVLHFAAFTYVGESVTDPGKYYDNNVCGTISLLEAMRAAKCRNIIFSSTCAVYGNPESVPMDESTPKGPINPYGHCKLMVEQALRDYAAAYGTGYAALRYFNAAGADFAAGIGEDHDPETHLIPLIIEAAMGRREHISIFGTDYPTPDGTAIRDYVHVTDLADAHVRALSHLLDDGGNLELNLGTGSGHSVREVIEAVGRVAGREIPTLEAPRRVGDPPALVAKAELA
ncbi:MAG: UDP-glucose 4-epimerase GalE, partial [Proteobacteria bacterium]|nr:UDP-glucose 4-epimerase GalE [Pseudomonadota bacterium]